MAATLLLLVLGSGCASTSARVVLDVPYCHAANGRCGDHSAREIVSYWQGDARLQGEPVISTTVGLLAAFNRAGLDAAIEEGSIDMIAREIAHRRPAVIVLSGYGGEYHCLTAVGCDRGKNEVLCHTRRGPAVVMPELLLGMLSPRAPWFVITVREDVEEPL